MRIFRRRDSEADLDAELRAYLDLLTNENLRAGMTPEAARGMVESWKRLTRPE